MQALLGSILAAGFAASFRRQIAASPDAARATDAITQALQASYASALDVAASYPQYRDELLAGATESPVTRAWAAHLVGAVAIDVGAGLVEIGRASSGDGCGRSCGTRWVADDLKKK